MKSSSAVAACLLLPLVGCAAYPAPTEKFATAVADIRAAEENGASGVPQAGLYLRLAQEEQARAKALLDDGKNQEAELMTLKSISDAELAVSLARESAAQTKAAAAEAKAAAATQEGKAPAVPSTFTAITTTTSTTVPASK
jgi:hypothetical protein